MFFKRDSNPKPPDKAQIALSEFFSDALSGYDVTIDSPDLKYKDNGYAVLIDDAITFFDKDQQPLLTMQREDLIYAVIKEFDGYNITMLFQNNIFVTAAK